jgi:transposase-like protein
MADINAADLIKKITDAKGNVSAVARAFGVSRKTIYNHIERYKTAQDALEDARETMLDNAESILYKKVLEGSTPELLFFLKTQGKRRGYVERSEVTGADGSAIPVAFVDYRQGLKSSDDSTDA